MKFTVDATKMKRAFNALGDVITGNIPNPLTTYVRWHLLDNTLLLEATSADSGVILNMGVEVEGRENGECWLEHAAIDRALSCAAADEQIKFAMTDKIHMRTQIGTRKFSWKAAAGNWPEMPVFKAQAYPMPAKLIKELMKRGAVGATKVGGKFDSDAIKLGFNDCSCWIESVAGPYGVRVEAVLPDTVPTRSTLLLKKHLKAIHSILIGEENLVVRIGDFRTEFITEFARLSVGTISGNLPSMRDLISGLFPPLFITFAPATLSERLTIFQGMNDDGCVEFDLQEGAKLILRASSDIRTGQRSHIEDELTLLAPLTVVAQFRVEYWQQVLSGIRDIPEAVFGLSGMKEPAWVVGASDLVKYTAIITPRAMHVKMNANVGRSAWDEE